MITYEKYNNREKIKRVILDYLKLVDKRINKMDNEKAFNGKNSSDRNVSAENNVTDNSSDRNEQGVARASKSERQSMNIDKEENVRYNPDDPQTKTKVKNIHKAEVSPERDEAAAEFSSTNRKKKITVGKTVSSKIPVKIKKIIKRKNDRTEKKLSLRCRVLIIMTIKNYFSELAKFSESYEDTIEFRSNFQKLHQKMFTMLNNGKTETRNQILERISPNPTSNESSESRSNYQNLQYKESEISNERMEETRKDLIENFDTNPSCANQFQHVFSDKSRDVTINENQPTCSPKSTSAVTISTAAESENTPGREVWKRFKKFLDRNKENIDRVVIDDIGREHMENSDYLNYYLDNTRREYTSQSFEEPLKRKAKNASNVMEDNLKCDVSKIPDDTLKAALEMVVQFRYILVKHITTFEKLVIIRKVDSQLEMDLEKQIKFINAAGDSQKRLHKLLTALCDHEKTFLIIKKHLLNLCNSMYNWSNVTTLIDLPLSEMNVSTISSLIFCQYKSLYHKAPMERVFKNINVNQFLTCRNTYRNFKAYQEVEKEKSKNEANQVFYRFNAHLKRCLLIFKNEIPSFENASYEDVQAFINNLKVTIKGNLSCLNELISATSSLVFPVALYLKETRKLTLLDLLHLDRRLDTLLLSKQRC